MSMSQPVSTSNSVNPSQKAVIGSGRLKGVKFGFIMNLSREDTNCFLLFFCLFYLFFFLLFFFIFIFFYFILFFWWGLQLFIQKVFFLNEFPYHLISSWTSKTTYFSRNQEPSLNYIENVFFRIVFLVCWCSYWMMKAF